MVCVFGVDEDFVEVFVLVYDFGYLFFGYEGECVLVECMKVFGGFDYNV